MSFPGLRGEPLEYFDHPYNRTAHNERAIEVPIALGFIHPGEGLEVGNVLSHYVQPTWRIVDRLEQGLDVDNIDVLDIDGSYDWIVSISTLEHVGQDEPDQDPDKPLAAVKHLRSLLNRKGRLLITIPTGWNLPLDERLPDLAAQAAACSFYRRTVKNRWKRSELQTLPYGHAIQSATGLFAAEFAP